MLTQANSHALCLVMCLTQSSFLKGGTLDLLGCLGNTRGPCPLAILCSLLRSRYGLETRNAPAERRINPNQTPAMMDTRLILSRSSGSRFSAISSKWKVGIADPYSGGSRDYICIII